MFVLSVASVIARIVNLDPFVVDQGIPVFETLFLYLPTIILLAASLRERPAPA